MARTATHFEKQLDRLYIENSFDSESQSIVAEMIRQIQSEFGQMLEEADWMEGRTRQRALAKFRQMGALVGYFEQIKDDRRLEEENRWDGNWGIKPLLIGKDATIIISMAE